MVGQVLGECTIGIFQSFCFVPYSTVIVIAGNSSAMRDQRQWSVKECCSIFCQCLGTLKQNLAAQGDGGILVWDKVSFLVLFSSTGVSVHIHGTCTACFLFLLLFYFLTTLLSQWDFFRGKFGLPSPGKASCDRVALPNLRCMLSVLVFS